MNPEQTQKPQSSDAFDRVVVILTGTDPKTARGGIGVVMSGYQRALQSIPVKTTMMPTYRPASWRGKWQPWLATLFRLPGYLRKTRKQGRRPVVYSHCGALPSMLRESVVLLIARLFGARTILQVHAPEMARYLSNPVLRPIIRTLFRPAQFVCALTPWWANQMEQANIAQKLSVIPNPLPSDLEDIARLPMPAASDSKNITVLIMTRLVTGKGADIVLRAMQGIGSEYRLIIAGDGDQKPALERLAAELGVIANVEFAGWVSGDQKDRLLREATVFCLPSTYDVFPMSIVEAMANGKPVVSVRWGGLPDLVADEETGLLCKPGNAGEIRTALQRLADANLRQTMGALAKERILAMSEPSSVGRLLSRILKDVLA